MRNGHARSYNCSPEIHATDHRYAEISAEARILWFLKRRMTLNYKLYNIRLALRTTKGEDEDEEPCTAACKYRDKTLLAINFT